MKTNPIAWYRPGKTITVHDKMQRNYSYTLSAPYGQVKSGDFQPGLTPAEMLAYGVFEGKYMNDCIDEFPQEWYKTAKISTKADPSINCFGIKSRLSLPTWQKNGWIIGPDVRGWFQWYCRYYIGRRLPDVDAVQMARWRAFQRHRAQVVKNCAAHDLQCRPRQRQALLQWAYNPFL